MRTITLHLDNNEALALDHCLNQRFEELASLALQLDSEGRKIEAADTMRHAQRVQRIRDNLTTLGRQHFIGL